MRILVIGGAGFIGSHTVDELLIRGHEIIVMDNLSKPVHLKGKPNYLQPEVEFIEGDIRDERILLKCMKRVNAVYNFAAYQDYLPDFSTYFDVNCVGTALLYELIVKHNLPISKVIVASSQAVAGEGLYKNSEGKYFKPNIRPNSQLEKGHWEIIDPSGGRANWQKTPENVRNPQNQYGLSKLNQEDITLSIGKRYNIPSVAMRYSIVQGARQSFYNAYSGACRIFCLSLYFDKAATLFEDGQQIRDFVNIHDVVDGNIKVLEDDRANYRSFNLGGGKPYTVNEFAKIVQRVFGKEIEPKLSGYYRFGDTRHIVSDISAMKGLGWAPKRNAEDSVSEYLNYLKEQTDIEDILDYTEKNMKALNVIRRVKK